MLNQYPLWKYLLIVLVLSIGFIYAAPNLYEPDPAIQISGQSSATVIDSKALGLATADLQAAGIGFFGAEVDEKGSNALIRLEVRDQQLAAQKVVQRALGLSLIHI